MPSATRMVAPLEAISAAGQQGGGRGVGQVSELDLYRGTVSGERLLDLVEGRRVGYSTEAESSDLVER